jgi:uncharacterized membrane protein YcaP (DUF421 family)
MVILNVIFSFVKLHFPRVSNWIDGVPMIVVKDGKFLTHRMRMSRISEDDVMEAARERKGIESIDQIRYAILEKNGAITVIANEVPESEA